MECPCRKPLRMPTEWRTKSCAIFPQACRRFGFAQWSDVALNLNRRHACGKIAHDLVRHSVGILSGLRQGRSILQPGDHVVAPKARMLIGELVGAQTQRNPKLCLVQAAEL